MTPGPAGDPYYRAVEEEFARRRKAALLLSPRDWSLIGEWKDAGVPLRVVLQAIHNVFDAFERRAPAGRRVNSLSYCRQEVLALHDLYRTLHAAEAGRPPDSEITAGSSVAERHLGRLIRRVRAALTLASEARRDPLVACLARIAADLKLLRRDIKTGVFDAARLEEDLRRFDEDLLAAGRLSLGEASVRALEETVDRDLEGAGARMTPKARDTTRRALVARLVRAAVGLPRLTLFG